MPNVPQTYTIEDDSELLCAAPPECKCTNLADGETKTCGHCGDIVTKILNPDKPEIPKDKI